VAKGIVALVGRPNVGKSTLFNAFTRTRQAIVDNRPGVTRDRIYGITHTMDAEIPEFGLIDTGGFETDRDSFQPFKNNLVWKSTLAAIDEADVVVLIFDLKAGVHPYDRDLVRLIHRLDKPVVYAVNKVDGIEMRVVASEFYELGIDEIEMVSAAHNRGIDELKDEVIDRLKNVPRLKHTEIKVPDSVCLSVIGRPNAGKSSLVNRLLGYDRSIVSEVAGTTRDSIDSHFTYNRKQYTMIDTAGIRRRSRVKEKLEIISVHQSLEAIERADVILLVLDAAEGFADQDARLASRAAELCKPILVVVNKWDLVPDKQTGSSKIFQEDIAFKMPELAFAPFIFISCETNQRVQKIMVNVERLAAMSQKRVATSELNRNLEEIVAKHTPALNRATSKRAKFYYATQVAVNPPTIVVKCNLADYLTDSYRRYMHRQFQARLGFDEIPLKLFFRSKETPSLEKR
jgi:GTPase